VFIRSLATRGNLGGLSRATGDCIRVMDAMGRDVVLVETVGVGQDEIDIAQMAHTTVVVVVPGMGDDIQAIKAGILEVADLFAVNKADLDGADRVVRELRQMLELRWAALGRHPRKGKKKGAAAQGEEAGPAEWEPNILKTVAAKDQGIDELVAQIAAHRTFLEETGQKQEREQTRAQMQFVTLLRERLVRGALHKLERERGRLEEVAGQIALRQADPYALADELARQLGE
jgi:LAO/AO transport system kinase